jgi:hypothetical protein
MVGIPAGNGRQTRFRIGKTIIAGRTFQQQSRAVFQLADAELSPPGFRSRRAAAAHAHCIGLDPARIRG